MRKSFINFGSRLRSVKVARKRGKKESNGQAGFLVRKAVGIQTTQSKAVGEPYRVSSAKQSAEACSKNCRWDFASFFTIAPRQKVFSNCIHEITSFCGCTTGQKFFPYGCAIRALGASACFQLAETSSACTHACIPPRFWRCSTQLGRIHKSHS